MDPLDRLVINLNFAWLLILQYFGIREVMFAFSAVVIILSLAIINQRS
jgi:hypothetical protein